MSKYSLIRGKRSKMEWDVLVKYDGKTVFRGEFITSSDRRLKSDDIRVIDAIKTAIESLNEKK